MLQRYLWKLLPKSQRMFLLGHLSVVDRQAVNKMLSGNTRYPQPFKEHACIFIHVPKCAGSSVSSALFNGWQPGHLPLHWYEQQFPEEYRAAFKFSFVRDPLERAYSAYTYLAASALGGRDQQAQQLVNSYRDFDEFVSRWLDADNVRKQIHFAPQTDFLIDSLGGLKLDFIGRQERIVEDFKALCEHFAVDINLPHLNSSTRSGALPVHEFCTMRTRRLIKRVYHRDYQWLGYE